VIGVPSDDFKQEAKRWRGDGQGLLRELRRDVHHDRPAEGRGPDAAHLFKVLAEQSNAPKWNFYKYVVDRQGNVIASFSSLTKPDSPDLIEADRKGIASKP
jgi:glutathione peroxidase